MKIRYIALFLMLFALLLSCSEEVDQFPDLSKEVDQFHELSKRIPYFMERLHSNRLEVRSCLLDDLKGRDAETKLALETLIRDENNGIAQKALMRYLFSFVDIDKTLFRPELYFRAIVSDRFLMGGIPNEDQYDAFVDNCVRSLRSAKQYNRILQENLTIVGVMGKPGDAEAVYRFLQSLDDNIAFCAAKAVIRHGDRKKGMETLRRLASWDSSKEPPYMFHAFYALKELQDPELEAIVLDGVASIDRSEGIQPNWVDPFLLLAADVTSKDVWNVKEQRNRPEEAGQFPDLSRRVPYLMERLHSSRWKVRYCLLGDFTGRDIETKRVLEILIRDENKSVANQALVRYLHGFVDIGKTLFKPELYFISKPGDEFPEPDLLNEGRHDALVDYCLRRLDTAQLDDPGMYRILTVVGILGKTGDAEALYPFLQSANDYVALGAAKAVIRLSDRKKGMEAIRRLASRNPLKNLHYVTEALYALKEMQYPELEIIAINVLSSIDQSEGIQLNWLCRFLLLAADITSKDVWNMEKSQYKAGAGSGYHTFYNSYRLDVPSDNYIIIGMRGFVPENYLVLDMNINELRIYSPYKKIGWILQRKLTSNEADLIMTIFESPEYMDLPEKNMKVGDDAEEIEITSIINKRKKHIHYVMPENKTIRRIIDVYKEFTVAPRH